ncbi:MAG: TIGR04141 family sporadically distributed protein [Burkholderiales bacterium]|nr:TIGR04141 family sporadically distributed protein [Burkholderiales bacterium]
MKTDKSVDEPSPSANLDADVVARSVVEDVAAATILDAVDTEGAIEAPSAPKKFSVRLGAFLILSEIKTLAALLEVPLTDVTELSVDKKFGVDGVIFVKNKPLVVKRPPWAGYLDVIHGTKVDGLETASSSAVLIIKLEKGIVVFSFGYGRYLLKDDYLISDFGIKTALNTLDHNTLRTVDLFSLEQSPIQKRNQATRSANINDFGIDVSRDVLKGVTGEPVEGVGWSTISGGGNQYGFTVKIADYSELIGVAKNLVEKYELGTYTDNFSWVDNIQRVKNPAFISNLNDALIEKIREKNTDDVSLSLPDISDWSSIFGFSYTNGKNDYKSSPDIADYYSCNNVDEITIDRLKQHRLYYSLVSGEEFSFSLFNCIYFECIYEEKLYILFTKEWFTIDQDYVKRVNAAVQLVPLSKIEFPNVKLVEKKKRPKSRKKDVKEEVGEEAEDDDSTTLEAEGDYNIRVAEKLRYILLDRKLVKSESSASPVEVCDILSPEKHFIHAKHRKGSSSGLSHLFAQGRVAAELLLSDRNFRINARKHLDADVKDLIPIDRFKPKENQIVFLVLGVSTEKVLDTLPFFSKINLISACRNLSERQFNVSIAGAEVDSA